MPAYETDLQRTARSDTCPLNSNPLGIGRHAGGIADPFDGRIDEFRISHVQRFRNVRSLQKFAAVHASIQNHFNLTRHPSQRLQAEPRHRPGRVASVGGVKWVLDWLFGDQFALD